MEKRRRVYPNAVNRSGWVSGILLAASALLFLSGLIFRNESADFWIEQQMPEETGTPLNKEFDETPAETVIELAQSTWFALQTGVFENEEAAQKSANAFQKRGAAGYLWKDGRFRVLAAVYSTQEDARYVRQQLLDQHQIDSYLYTITFPAVSLRLKGMQGQMDILQAAFVHVHELAAQLQQFSVELDRQERSAAETVTQLQSLRTQLNVVRERLRQRFAAPMPDAVNALLACFENYAAFSDELTANESTAALGMKLKYQTFATLWNIQEIYQTLNRT